MRGVFSEHGQGIQEREEIPSLAVVPPPNRQARADLFKLEADAPPWTLLNK